jgi:hypothetical protein
MTGGESARVLVTDMGTHFRSLVGLAEHRLILCAPYITRPALEVLRQSAHDDLKLTGEVILATNLTPTSVQGASLDLRAMLETLALFGRSRLLHIPDLHAKIFIADDTNAIISSANLTTGGFDRNVEAGVWLRGQLARETAAAFDSISAKAREVSREDLDALASLAQVTPVVEAKPDRVLARAFRRLLSPPRKASPSTAANTTRLRPIVASTIIETLASTGPMLARDLEHAVRAKHPHLCDDTKVRAVAKKIVWRHEVHWALQELKHDQRVIHLAAKGEQGPWSLAPAAVTPS